MKKEIIPVSSCTSSVTVPPEISADSVPMFDPILHSAGFAVGRVLVGSGKISGNDKKH